MSTRRALAFGSVLVVLTACSPFLGVAERDFGQGRYLQASEVLGAHEADVGSLSPRAQAEYGLMRGLSLLALGDHEGAARWLGFAQRIEASQPGTLQPAQRAALARGLDDLARKTADARYASAPASAALAAMRSGAAAR